MRGEDRKQAGMFSYMSPEQRVPKDHPLRAIRVMTDAALSSLSSEFEKLYARVGRPSIAPEKLLRALLLQALYTVRSERLLMEQLDYNLLFRWFVGLNMDDGVWDPTVFTKNRERLLAGDIAQKFFEKVHSQAWEKGLLSDEHFTVDGTLIEAWAGQKSFKKKDQGGGSGDSTRNPSVEFRGEKRTNDTHQSSTDPEAKLYKKAKGQEAKLCYLGHALMENRNGLVVNGYLSQSTGTAEREAAVVLCDEIEGNHQVTLGADKNYDVRDLIKELRGMKVTPHVAQKQRGSALDGRTTRHPGYGISQTKRKRVEEIFGWLKTVGLMRKTRHRGVSRVGWMFTFTLAVYNLVRMRNLVQVA
jgi:transposase